MGNAINLTPYAVGELAGKDAEGFPLYVAVVKATWQWQQDGSIRQIAPVPTCERDEFAGEPATSGLLAATDLAPPKPRVDVLFKGTLTFPAPMTEVDVAVRMGTRMQKAAHVFGARYWLPGVVHDMKPRVDVLFKGTLTFPAPMTEVDVAVRMGTRMQKATST